MNSSEQIVDQSKIGPAPNSLEESVTFFSRTRSLRSLLPSSLAQRYQVVPLALQENFLLLGCAERLTPEAIDALQFTTDRLIEQQLLPPSQITGLLTQLFPMPRRPQEMQEELSDAKGLGVGRSIPLETASPADLAPSSFFTESIPSEAPVIRYTAMLLDEAIQTVASDLHLEFFETECKIRYRIDGILLEKKSMPRPLAEAIVSRLKFLAHLDITERRLPQDGRFQHTWNKITVDFRLSSLPTHFGESVVLRLLDRRNLARDLAALHLPSILHRALTQRLQQPHGLFIVTGPTGAGKTTTLYACLHELQQRKLKLLSVEDPVEYEIEGIIQVPVHEAIGRTFQRVLRSALRHDPDVIMIGETRDEVTARMAMQASLTGHLVLTTLHTNDAVGAIARLIDMQIDPLLIATTLEGVLAQRLVRKICVSCRIAYGSENFSPLESQFFEKESQPHSLWKGIGCEECHQTGYQGRIGLFELLLLNDELRLAIHEKIPSHQLRKKAMKEGMISLREDALRLVLEGITTVEEVRSSLRDEVNRLKAKD